MTTFEDETEHLRRENVLLRAKLVELERKNADLKKGIYELYHKTMEASIEVLGIACKK
jgi:hypothetical protein